MERQNVSLKVIHANDCMENVRTTTRSSTKKCFTSNRGAECLLGRLIPAEAVEDEIKSLYIDMGKPLARIGSYKSAGIKN